MGQTDGVQHLTARHRKDHISNWLNMALTFSVHHNVTLCLYEIRRPDNLLNYGAHR